MELMRDQRLVRGSKHSPELRCSWPSWPPIAYLQAYEAFGQSSCDTNDWSQGIRSPSKRTAEVRVLQCMRNGSNELMRIMTIMSVRCVCECVQFAGAGDDADVTPLRAHLGHRQPLVRTRVVALDRPVRLACAAAAAHTEDHACTQSASATTSCNKLHC